MAAEDIALVLQNHSQRVEETEKLLLQLRSRRQNRSCSTSSAASSVSASSSVASAAPASIAAANAGATSHHQYHDTAAGDQDRDDSAEMMDSFVPLENPVPLSFSVSYANDATTANTTNYPNEDQGAGSQYSDGGRYRYVEHDDHQQPQHANRHYHQEEEEEEEEERL
eukprot:TRINITY_DN445_c3_g1_i3.p1 TRINITY_DN445_c3_g1~~TRINITY_DN445_c3_g1_i3.p1  ORF type:complete len:168 (+),score=35.44 TRINITY_DN445_c3_g1_i3:138-641(+)